MSNLGENIISYPRGFKGLSLGHKPRMINRHRQYEMTAIGGIGFPNPVTIKEQAFNDDIDAAYYEMLNNRPGVNGSGFREKVYLLVLATFGNNTVSVKDFINWQTVDGKISQFIEDTFKYIQTGERDLALQMYDDMLTETNPLLIPLSKATYINMYFNAQKYSSVDLIQRWCSNQNGFYDMLCTMHILYGDEQ